MSNALRTIDEPTTAPSLGGALAMMPQTMEQAIRLAEIMATGKVGIPVHFHGQVGDCLMVIEQAMRWQMSPFAVAQSTSLIKGKLMFEGKLVAAAIECSGAIEGYFDYEFSGSGEGRTIEVSAKRRGDLTPRTVSVTLRDAATDNQYWKKQPDQQLVYHGARVWGRRWTPGVMLGVYSREEFNVGEEFAGTTLEHQEPEPPRRHELPTRQPLPPTKRREEINAEVPIGQPSNPDLDGDHIPDEILPDPKMVAFVDATVAKFGSVRSTAAMFALMSEIKGHRDYLVQNAPSLDQRITEAVQAATLRLEQAEIAGK